MDTIFSRALRPDCVKLDGKPGTIAKVLIQIAELAKKSRILDAISEDEIYDALEARERIGSTGFIKEAAIPHCTFEGISDFVVGVLVVQDGTDFNSIDDLPTKVFFFIVGPRRLRDDHITLLSTITKIMRNPDAVRRIRMAGDEGSLMKTVLSMAPGHDADAGQQERCLVQVFIQKQKLFRDILQALAETPKSSITVLDSGSTEQYLRMTPMYASRKHEAPDPYLKVIVATVGKSFCNDVIRRINIISDALEGEPGVLITVQELYYTNGMLKF